MQRPAPMPPPGYVLAAIPLPAMTMPPVATGGVGSGVTPAGPVPLGVAEVLRRVRSRWVLATVPVLVGVVAGGVLTFLTEPVYTARAAVLVQPVIAEQFGNVNIGNVLNMATEAEVAQSLGVAAAAGEQLGVPPDQVQDALSVTTAQDTEVLKISYRARTAEVAALGAQTVATSYLHYREANAAADADRRLASIAEQVALVTRLIAAGGQTSSYQDILRELLADRRELTSIKATSGGRVITEAVPPSSRTAPKPVTNLVAGGIAGGMTGLALAVFWPVQRWRSSVEPRGVPDAIVGGSGTGPRPSTGSGGPGPIRPRGARRIPMQPVPASAPAPPPPAQPAPAQPAPGDPRLIAPHRKAVADDDDDEQWWSKRSAAPGAQASGRAGDHHRRSDEV